MSELCFHCGTEEGDRHDAGCPNESAISRAQRQATKTLETLRKVLSDLAKNRKGGMMVKLLKHEDRPWGAFRVLQEEKNYVVKELRVHPGKRLSYQSHEFRDEIWTTVSGSGTAIIDDVELPLLPLPLPLVIHHNQKHRIINDTDEDLVIVEVWVGEDLSEDDITRHEDDYGRV